MSVDIFTIILTIVSFFLLAFLLNQFLYKPLVGFMEKRDAKIAKGLNEENEAREKLEAAEGLMNTKYKEATEEASAIIKDAKQKDRAAYDEKINKIHEQSAENIRQAGLDIKAQEALQLSQVDEYMPDLVCSLAEKFLGTSVPVSENVELIKAHLSENA